MTESKYREEFGGFFELMLEAMDATQEEKGNSWFDNDGEEATPTWLVNKLENKFHEYMEVCDINHLPALANYCAMVYLRSELKNK